MLRFEDAVVRQGGFSLSADFAVGPGCVAVMGPSGAGKSTLLGALAGFAPLQAGQITWLGQRIDRLDPADRPLSMLFQDNNLLPHLSAFDNVALGISPALRLDAGQRKAVIAALEEVGIADLAARKPAQLSGGQAGRVALARVLLRRRPILALDEPFAALGPALKRAMLDLVASLARREGTTVLMVSHDPADALRICPETIVVAEGKAGGPHPTGALLASPPAALADYLG
ncbi:MAG: ATP-binding cassette domain-containing protein [Paracoccaceae bacterium]